MLCQQYKCYKVKITFVHESCGVLIKSKTLILYNSNNTWHTSLKNTYNCECFSTTDHTPPASLQQTAWSQLQLWSVNDYMPSMCQHACFTFKVPPSVRGTHKQLEGTDFHKSVEPNVATGKFFTWVCHCEDNWKNLTPFHSTPSTNTERRVCIQG